jgi:hypothetical protein
MSLAVSCVCLGCILLREITAPFTLQQDTDIALKWNKIESMSGDVPGPRSGHTLSVVGDEALLFGGLDPALKEFTKPNGKTEKRPGPNSDLYRVKLPVAGSTAPLRWVKVATSQSPPARYGHTATVVGENRLLIFGGFASSSQRFGDVHVLNTKVRPSEQFSWWHRAAFSLVSLATSLSLE